MKITERLEKLRELMRERGIDFYIIPSDDYHQSEYVGEYFKCREWISGFTGSAGVVVVSLKRSGTMDRWEILYTSRKTIRRKWNKTF